MTEYIADAALGHERNYSKLNAIVNTLASEEEGARTMYRLIKWLKQEHIRQREVQTQLSGWYGRHDPTSECGRTMLVMERLYERDQRHGETLDMLIRLIAAFEDCKRQVGNRIFELVGAEPEDTRESYETGSGAGSVVTMDLDFGTIGEDVLESTWFGWNK